MLDIKAIRKDPETFKKSLSRKGIQPSQVDALLATDIKKRDFQQQVENLKAKQNEVSKQIPQLSGEEKAKVLEEMKTIADERKAKDQELTELEETLKIQLFALPNPPGEDVPQGKDEDSNVVVETIGTPRVFDFPVKDHVELGKITDTIDLDSAANKTSGARFYFLKNELPLLEYALQRWAWDTLRERGFTPITTPMMIRGEAFARARKTAGGLDGVNEGSEFFRLADDPLFLIGTAEHITLNLHSDEIIEEADFPKKYAAWSSCFRREAGAAGKDTTGILRVHQFEKMEMLVFCLPEESDNVHKQLVENQKFFFTELGIPFQVVEACTGDMGFSDAKQFDLEAWFPGQEKYREVTSASNCQDFQTRSLNVKVKRPDGTKEFAHALNATGISMTRALITIMENYQQEDGSILIPEVLKSYCGFDRIEVK